jgi:hypothetical protein
MQQRQQTIRGARTDFLNSSKAVVLPVARASREDGGGSDGGDDSAGYHRQHQTIHTV